MKEMQSSGWQVATFHGDVGNGGTGRDIICNDVFMDESYAALEQAMSLKKLAPRLLCSQVDVSHVDGSTLRSKTSIAY